VKRILAGAAIVGALVGWTGRAPAAERILAANLRENLFATCFSSPTEGWAVGDLGRIFHTTDAGKSWEVQSAGTRRPFVAISCIDDLIWVAGQSGQIAFSADGGKTWNAQNSGTNYQILGISFVTPQRGVAVGDFGTLLQTDDGGRTWNKRSMPADLKLPEEFVDVVDPGDVLLYASTFGDAEHVWVVGEFGIIINSSDGGVTWQQQASGVQTTLFGARFADPQRGWAVGIDAVMLMTTDGGATWVRQPVQSPKGFTLSLYDVMVQGNYGWAIGNSGFLLQTQDAGRTWQLVDVPVKLASSWFRGISLLPDGRGYVVGARGLVLAMDRDKYTTLKEHY
jgi:photosystem II stability/assembly factor-like uncharacterized protein